MVFNSLMIKAGMVNGETKSSFQKILEEELAAEVGEAGLLNSDILNSLGLGAMSARSEIPPSHRRVADSYIFMKKLYGNPVVQGKISRAEVELLRKYDFNRLEFTTIRQINEEIAFLQSASLSFNSTLRTDADRILEIRAKELKFIIASKYVKITNDIFNGYQALIKYFELITTYAKPSNSV